MILRIPAAFDLGSGIHVGQIKSENPDCSDRNQSKYMQPQFARWHPKGEKGAMYCYLAGPPRSCPNKLYAKLTTRNTATISRIKPAVRTIGTAVLAPGGTVRTDNRKALACPRLLARFALPRRRWRRLNQHDQAPEADLEAPCTAPRCSRFASTDHHIKPPSCQLDILGAAIEL